MNMTQLYRISEKTLTGGTPPESVHASRKRLARLATRMSPDQSQVWLNWVIITDETRHYIGYVQATVSEMVADIAWVIGRAYQGKGYGTEAAGLMMAALKEAGIKKLMANLEQIHSLEKLRDTLLPKLMSGEVRVAV